MTDTPTTLPDNAGLAEIVAKAICKSRTCEGFSCCQWPANGGRTKCPVKAGAYDDAARDAIAAYEALRPSVWMDISTAPKDGTRILAYWRGNGDQEVVYWSIGQSCWFDTVAGIETVAPTHWTHLPTPPKAHTP